MQIQPYLSFDGRCEEAIEFYRRTLGAKVEMLMRFKEAPEPGMSPPEAGEKVMHSALRIGDSMVLASDGRCLGKPNFQGFALSLTAPEGRLVYTGDTGPSRDLARWASGADLLLAECSLPADQAIDTHLTPEQAGELARDAGAGRLVLTHFYPPVETSDPARAAGTRFQGGAIAAARDGDRFTIARGGK